MNSLLLHSGSLNTSDYKLDLNKQLSSTAQNPSTNFMQVVKQTKEEKMKMYMKLPKKKLAEMLIEANRVIQSRPLEVCNIPVYNDLDIKKPKTTTGRLASVRIGRKKK